MNFRDLHKQSYPLLLFNVWDVPSCKLAQESGYQAIGTSSAAIASILGYQDGEQIPFEEVLFIVEKISKSTALPLSVDIEGGYSRDPKQISLNVLKLLDFGVVGINIEDGLLEREIGQSPAEDFSIILKEIKESLRKRKAELFINVRIDTFLLNAPNKLVETLSRIQIYEEAGADGIFIPGLTNIEDIKTIVEATKLPINVMLFPNLPNFNQLHKLGVKRISLGSGIFNKMCTELELVARKIYSEKAFEKVIKC